MEIVCHPAQAAALAAGTADWAHGGLRVVVFCAGVGLILLFFKSIIRVGILNQRYQDSIAFWVGRLIWRAFQLRIGLIRVGHRKGHEILTWYWPTALIGLVSSWFVLVTIGFAFLNWSLGANAGFMDALISSGSSLSTLGFSTPTNRAGELLAIIEGGFGLFLVVYLFTFLPGFMDMIHDRWSRVAWVYSRTGPHPSGSGLLEWFYRNGRSDELDAVFDSWDGFFRDHGQAKSFLPIIAVVPPLHPGSSWICAFGAFLDAAALMVSTVERNPASAKLCCLSGVESVRNIHLAMRGTPVVPRETPGLLHVKRAEYDAACARLAAAGAVLVPDRERAWLRFIDLHRNYEQEISWLAAALSDPTPFWPQADPPDTHPTENGHSLPI